MKTISASLALSALIQGAAPAPSPLLSAPSATSAGLPAAAIPAAALPAPLAAAPSAAGPAAPLAALAAPAALPDGSARPEPGALEALAGAFDGTMPKPAFEPPVEENVPQRPQLSFPLGARSALLAIEPGGLRGVMKLVKDSSYSRDWWGAYRAGREIDVVVRGESMFNRPTKITSAATKPISKLTREDFEGTVPAHMLQIGVAALRKQLIASLEESRRRWTPEAAPVGPDSRVRVIKFKPYLELFRETHGPDAVPEPARPAPREPLKARAEGALKPLSLVLPRAVMIDLDMLDGPIPKELLSDIAKLQRTGVYFVAFSRKPFSAAGSVKDKLVRQLSAYQLGTLMPIRFMMATDDGAVLSGLSRGGGPEPFDVLRFTPAEIDVLRDAAKRAAEAAGLSPRAVSEVRQPPLVEDERERPGSAREAAPDPRVRFEVRLPKSLTPEGFARWRRAFDSMLKAHGMELKSRAARLDDGRFQLVVQRTDLAGSMERIRSALGETFGLYLNDGDALVLTGDETLMAANPRTLDVARATGLKGRELVENALGLMLGEHREDAEGDLAGSASRMASFSRDRRRYLSEALVKSDAEEQNINFFSGHVVHAANDWLIGELRNGRRPTKEEFAERLRARWNVGMREFKAVGLPSAHTSEGWLKASLTRALNMYDIVVKIAERGEVLVGTEIPNFFMLKDYARRSGELKRRYILHTIFDFVALRPDPRRPGHATLVIYDFKTGPAKTRPKLDKDIQVLTYALFAHEKWVGEKFPVPYLSGSGGYVIDDVSVEFIYSRKLQTTDVDRWSLDQARRKIIGTLNRIHAAEQKLYGYAPGAKTKPKKRAARP